MKSSLYWLNDRYAYKWSFTLKYCESLKLPIFLATFPQLEEAIAIMPEGERSEGGTLSHMAKSFGRNSGMAISRCQVLRCIEAYYLSSVIFFGFHMLFLLKVLVQMHLFIFQWWYRIQYGIVHFALFVEQVRCICMHVHNMTWFCGHGKHGTHKSVWHDMSLFPGAITCQDKAA